MTDERNFFFEELGINPSDLPAEDTKYSKIGLKFNPFPKSGTTNIRTSTEMLKHLKPVDDDIKRSIAEYLSSTLFSKSGNAKDKFMGATILGNYGSGKTQLLMYVKYLLELAATNKDHNVKPYVIYISNPKLKLSELIGSIVAEIGEENFKKFLWNKIIKGLEQDYKSLLESEFNINPGLFGAAFDPWTNDNRVNYKKHIDAWYKNLAGNKPKLKVFEARIEEYITKILNIFIQDSSVSTYFYKILIEDFGFNAAWENIIKGESKQVSNKEASIIKSIIALLYEEGYTHIYVLVDEFEDITRGRLSKAQVDNYLYSLRTLIDHERNWTIMFAMTEEAFNSLEQASPPLADRISRRKIRILNLNNAQATQLIINYLNTARESESQQLVPFTDSAVNELVNNITPNNPGVARIILSTCFKVIEHAANNGTTSIDSEVISNVFTEL